MNWQFPAWDPVMLDLPGPLDLRWYGLMYVVGFVAAQFIMTRLQRDGFFRVQREQVADLIFYTVIGTILGGRIGYALFYGEGMLNPLKLVKVWEGGLSFHGGLIGVCVAFYLFARKSKVPILRVGDVCALAVTPGIFAVRMANFVNGELYGRTTTAETFGAMRFPTDPAATRALGLAGVPADKRQIELAIQYAYDKVDRATLDAAFGVEQAAMLEPRLDWDVAREAVPFRHPSQLYEAAGEGLLIGLVMLLCYRLTRARPWGAGAYGGVFLIGYGVVRFSIEYLRQPDAQFTGPDDPVGTVFLGLTMGQTLCAVMVVAGALLLATAGRRADDFEGDAPGGPEAPIQGETV